MTPLVLHVINTVEVGGGGQHLALLIPGLSRFGFSSAVAVGRDGPMAERLRQAGASVKVIGPLGIPAIFSLARHFMKTQPDLVHLHGSRSGVVGSLAARAAGVRPIVYTAHAFAFRRRVPLPVRWVAARAEALTCRLADRVICLSQGDLSRAAKAGIRTVHFSVVPNGVSLAPFAHANGRREEFGFNPNVLVVGMLGRLVPQKDPLTFLQMARFVSKEVPAARFLLVGDGPLRPQVERTIVETKLQERVIVTGFRNDVPELLHTMDIVVLTSLWEGMPLVLLEAMAAHRPVVATRVEGSSEVVVDGETGYLVPPQDPGKLAAAVIELFQDPARRQQMGQRGRERVEREFSSERMVRTTVELYKAVLPN